MEKKNIVTLRQYLSYERDDDSVFNAFYSLDRQLEYLHSKEYCVDDVNADHILYDGVFQFSNVTKIKDLSQKEELIEKNIKDLVKLSLGVYVSLDMGERVFFDYTTMNDEFIRENYPWIRNSIPKDVEYYDQIMNSEMFDGFEPVDYLNNYDEAKNNETSRKASSRLVKSTAAGKAMVSDQEVAFVNAIFYPAITLAILLCIGVIYLLYLYL